VRVRATFKSIGDKEHLELAFLYAFGLGYNKLSGILGRSTKSLYDHLIKHNSAVKRSGFCAICKRTEGKYSCKAVKSGIAKKEGEE
jgi:hypothetical protein